MSKQDKFKKMKALLGGAPKGTKPEKEASKNPKKYLETHKNMSIKNLKGVAF